MRKIWIGWPILIILGASCSSTPIKIVSNSLTSVNKSHWPPSAKSNYSPKHQAKSLKAVVAAEGQRSAEAALEVIKEGGNIFDAAITLSFMLAVERPHSTGLGGGGLMIFTHPQSSKPLALDFRELAPMVPMPPDKKEAGEGSEVEIEGGHSSPRPGRPQVAVPGMVAGLLEIHKSYSSKPLERLLRPAMALAQQGFVVDEELATKVQQNWKKLSQYPSSRRIFSQQNEGKTPLKVGDLLIQKDLSQTLKAIASAGKRGFYEGKVAKSLTQSQQNAGGAMSLSDLQSYTPKYRQPLEVTYRKNRIYTFGPPSAGGVQLLQILKTIESDPLSKWGALSAKTIHLLTGAMQLAFADRQKYLGDLDFVSVPLVGMISKNYGQSLRKKIPSTRALSSSEISPGRPYMYESGETTHFSIMDDKGNALSSSQTLNSPFGSGLIAEGTGVLLNNALNLFSHHDSPSRGRNNKWEGRKRPLTSMAPTLVTREGQAYMALGSPGGLEIPACLAQVLVNKLVNPLTLIQAIARVRFHSSFTPKKIALESTEPLPPQQLTELVKYGYQLQKSESKCRVQAVINGSPYLRAVSDPRGSGLAVGI